jgi:ATP phosphoribosyltransferase regulatory subunit
MAGPLADAEIIAMCVKALHSAGLENCHVQIGHTGITRQILRDFELDERLQQFLFQRITSSSLFGRGKTWVREEVDRLLSVPSMTINDSPIGELPSQVSLNLPLGSRSQEDIMRRINRRKQQSDQRDKIMFLLGILESFGAITGSAQNAFEDIQQVVESYTLSDKVRSILNSWQFTVSLIEAYGISDHMLTISPNMTLSWEYYTGIVFRVMAGSNVIAGGGRYDEFIRLFGGKADVPAIGFAIDLDAIIRSKQDGCGPTRYPEGLPVYVRAGCEKQAINVVQTLRDNGIAAWLSSLNDSQANPIGLIVESSGIRRNDQVYGYGAIDQIIADIRRT